MRNGLESRGHRQHCCYRGYIGVADESEMIVFWVIKRKRRQAVRPPLVGALQGVAGDSEMIANQVIKRKRRQDAALQRVATRVGARAVWRLGRSSGDRAGLTLDTDT